MTMHERLISEFGNGLGAAAAPDAIVAAEALAEGRAVLLRADHAIDDGFMDV